MAEGTAKKTAAKKAADKRDDGSTGIAQPADPNQPYTTVDGDDIERIVSPAQQKWSPAPVEADPHQVERAKEREKALEEARKERTTPPGKRDKDED